MPNDERTNRMLDKPSPKDKRFNESYEGEKPPGRKPPRPQFKPVEDQGGSSDQQGQGTEQE